MKLITHYVFSAGLLTLSLTLVRNPFPESLFLALLMSVAGNLIIDGLGHEERRGYVRRTPLTHTIPRSIFWGALPGAAIIILLYYLSGRVMELIYVEVMMGSLLMGPSHMILDIFTERGVFVKRRGRWVRLALAHFSYNDVLINGVAMIMGLLMIFTAYTI